MSRPCLRLEPMKSPRLLRGYSLLELMIALGLLTALLSAGWSILGTYRDAQERGWATVDRIQAVQVAHQWLQADLLQVIQPAHSSSPSIPSSSPASAAELRSPDSRASLTELSAFGEQSSSASRLVGNSSGFRVTIMPAYDPLPLIDRLLSVAEPSPKEPTMDIGLSLDSQNSVQRNQQSLWPDQVQVQYELISVQSMLVGTETIESFNLVRKLSAVQSRLNASSGSFLEDRSQRMLSLTDLYGQAATDANSYASQGQRRQLPGLANASFWYSDGKQWKRSWSDSRRLPAAVSLMFDYLPRGKKPMVVGRQETTTTNVEDDSSADFDRLNSSSATTATLAEADLPGTGDSYELREYDVRIVVRLERIAANRTGDRSTINYGPQE